MPDDDYGFEFSDEEEEVRQLTCARALQRRTASATSTLPAQATHTCDLLRRRRMRRCRSRTRTTPPRVRAHRVARRTKGLSPEQLRPGLLESDDPREALAGFASVIELEKEQGEWCVRAALH